MLPTRAYRAQPTQQVKPPQRIATDRITALRREQPSPFRNGCDELLQFVKELGCPERQSDLTNRSLSLRSIDVPLVKALSH